MDGALASVVLALFDVEAPVLRFYAVIPLIVPAVTLLTAAMRRRRAFDTAFGRTAATPAAMRAAPGVGGAHVTQVSAGRAARLSEIAAHVQASVRVGAAGTLPTRIEAFAQSHRRGVDELTAFVATH